AGVGLEDLVGVLVDDHLVAAHLAVDAIAGGDLELQGHAAAVGVTVDRDLADDAVVVPGELRALLGDVPLLALLLLVTARRAARVLPDPKAAHVGGRPAHRR